MTDCNVGRYIITLVNPLAQDEYSLRETFGAAERIKKILRKTTKKMKSTQRYC